MEDALAGLLENITPILAAAVAALVAWGVKRVNDLVKRTENELDDKAFNAFVDGVVEGRRQKERADAGDQKADD